MTPTPSDGAWRPLPALELERLRTARAALHHALQVPAALHVGRFAAQADQSHTSFAWRDDRFVSSGDPALPWVAALDPVALAVELRATGGEGGARAVARVDLEGRSLDEAHAAWQSALDAHLGAAPYRRLEVELPEHPVASGARFARDELALTALRDAFADAALALDGLRPRMRRPSPRRVWPHHFDIAVLDALDPEDADPEAARSVGVGMTPGDGGVPEPYYYVTPWPYPAATALPPLPAGRWTTEGWVGALLPASAFTDLAGDAQEARVRAFLEAAYGASRALLEAAGA
ncbi:MAG: hypothetical protein P1P87_03290 [Trueperaceae bacterium]|nr:hypothetical protein [Trueperaceae bacterium]